jgi:hypothetical protein
MIIPMIIWTIRQSLLDPDRTDDTPHVTGLNPTGADQADAEHPPTELAAGDSSPSELGRDW